MARDQTVFFTCPGCEERFCTTEEVHGDLHTGETYHCGNCGIQVVFQAVTAEDYVPPPRARRDCTYCGPSPRNCCTFTTTPDPQKGGTT